MHFLPILALHTLLICGLDGSASAQQEQANNSFTGIPGDAMEIIARYLGPGSDGALQQSKRRHQYMVRRARLEGIRCDYKQLIQSTDITAKQISKYRLCGPVKQIMNKTKWAQIQRTPFIFGWGRVGGDSGCYLMVKVERNLIGGSPSAVMFFTFHGGHVTSYKLYDGIRWRTSLEPIPDRTSPAIQWESSTFLLLQNLINKQLVEFTFVGVRSSQLVSLRVINVRSKCGRHSESVGDMMEGDRKRCWT